MDTPFFTLELEHGGLFYGPRNNMEYYNPSVEVIDYVDAGTFSYSAIEEHLLWLGYPVAEHIIYWCMPDKMISDGMLRIRGDEDVQHMIRASSQHKVLALMVDHADFISNCKEDLVLTVPTVHSFVMMARSNIVAASVASSHSLISIIEELISEVAADNIEADNLVANGTETETLLTDGAEDVVLSDSEFSDSDYDIDDGDDDLYEDNIDFDV